MPTLDDKANEQVAILGLCAALRLRGTPATILKVPEDDPSDPLTVDALLRLDGQEWAVEHARVAYQSRLVPASDSVRRALQGPLEELTKGRGRGLWVSVLPPPPPIGSPEGRAYCERVRSVAEAALDSGEAAFDDDGFTTVQLIDDPTVAICTFLAADPRKGSQVEEGIAGAVRKKLSGQLLRAKQAGYKVLLLLDQVQPASSRQPSRFLASPQTVAAVVRPLLDAQQGVVDEVWLRDPHANFHMLA
jgi:hypothetical protein